MVQEMISKMQKALHDIRVFKPTILCMTNYVTMDFMANVLLALGAKPLMSFCNEELEELIQICNALNINIGTLDAKFIEQCKLAVKFAKAYNKPIVFDPVGSGASKFRTNSAREIGLHADIIRGNTSEILSFMDENAKTLGVESTHQTDDFAYKIAMDLAIHFNSTVMISGTEDFITDGSRNQSLYFGSKIMSLITGMGCGLNAIIAAFRAVEEDSFHATELAAAYFSLCGNLTEAKCNTPGKFRTLFIDELYLGDFGSMNKMIDIHE